MDESDGISIAFDLGNFLELANPLALATFVTRIPQLISLRDTHINVSMPYGFMLINKRCVLLPPLVLLSLFIVVLGSTRPSIWSCVAHAPRRVASSLLSRRLFTASELLVSWFWGRALLGLACVAVLHALS
jgi:hypothetical protein